MSVISKRVFIGMMLFAWAPFVVRAVQIYVSANFPQASMLAMKAETFREFFDQMIKEFALNFANCLLQPRELCCEKELEKEIEDIAKLGVKHVVLGLWDAQDDATNLQRNLNTGEVEVEDGVIYHKTEYRERRNHYAVYSVNAPVAGFDTDRESFLGAWNGFGEPQVVAEGRSRNSVASGWSPIGSHQLAVDLLPGEEKTFEWGFLDRPWD